jgi:hypothetical protein
VIRRITDAALVSLSEQFGALYAEVRRPSIAPCYYRLSTQSALS